MGFSLISPGSTGIKIPPLEIGTWLWRDWMFWGYDRGDHKVDIREAFATCMQAGINFFDTAGVYAGSDNRKR
jgi:aryl-alcohol dehydrogenase-like predicted oxidoreductase